MEPLEGELEFLYRYTADFGGVLEVVFVLSDACLEFFVAVCTVIDEFMVDPVVLNDVFHQAVQELDIGSRVVLDVQIGLFCRWSKTRVTDDDFCSLLLGLHDSAGCKRVGFKVVGTNDKSETAVCQIHEGVGGCTGSKDHVQTGDGRCVA